MLTFKYRKYGDAVYISHTDMLRTISRTLRRMGINVEYSKGFNPRPLINLSQPLALGVASNSEWVTIQTEYKDTQKFIDLFNQSSPKGIEALLCYFTHSKPNIAGKVIAADYLINNIKNDKLSNRIDSIKKAPYFIKAKTKKGFTEREISSLIYSYELREHAIYIMLPFGNENIRIDNLAEKLNEDFDLDIRHSDVVRLNQYTSINGTSTKVEDYLREIK